MFGSFTAAVVRYFINRKALFFLFFGTLSAILVAGVFRLNIQEDIYSIFPKGKQFQGFNQLLQENKLNKQVIFSIPVTADEGQTYENLDQTVQSLERDFKPYLSNFDVYQEVDEGELIRYLQQITILYLTPTDYKRIDDRIQQDSIPFILRETANRISGSNVLFLQSILARDPLGLTLPKLNELNPAGDSASYLVKDGLIYTKDEKHILFFAALIPDIKDTKSLIALNHKLEQWKNTKAINGFDYFGTFQIAAVNAEQVKHDSTITSAVSLSLILLLLIIYYRSLLAPFYFVLPGIFGILSGAGIVGYIHPDLNAISLATSSVLLGIVLDYSFHFYTHFKQTGNLLATVREISVPMITGSFTTIAALAALIYTDSVVLQDFGLIALCTLSGAVLFTLFFLPVFISVFNIRLPERKSGKRTHQLPAFVTRLTIILVVIVTLFFSFNLSQVHFDADLNNLSYHTTELKEKEAFYTGIQPAKQKKVYLIAADPNDEIARIANDSIYSLAIRNKDSFRISELLSSAPYLPARKTIQTATNTWDQFWKNKKQSTEVSLLTASQQFGFSKSAFTPFYEWTNNGVPDTTAGKSLFNQLKLNKLYNHSNGKYTYITSIVLDRSELAAFKQKFKSIPAVTILDISEVAETLLESVQKDFNYLLVFSSLLVFISLLVVYGRIELAVFAFFPMVLSWIWILGIASYAGIPFNFVNIVIATFIFGLGDDFSIFMTDGLLQRYKTGIQSLASYRSAILLSAITTLIGTGALYFAKHPAIHSIAAISVLGISTILFVTLFIQPAVFHFFITNRIKKGRNPITFFTLIYSLFLFLYFGTGSIILNLILVFIIIPFPTSRKRKRQLLNFLISRLAKSTLYVGLHVRKRCYNRDKFHPENPCLIVANHSSFLDILMVLAIHPKTLIMVKKWVYNSPVFGLFIRYAGYLYAEDGAEQSIDLIKSRLQEGYSIVIFPEGTRSKDGEIKRFHKGAFYIAEQLQTAIQPVLLIGAHEVNPKNDFLINPGELITVFMDRIPYDPNMHYQERTKNVMQAMRLAFDQAKNNYANNSFWKPAVMSNYVLKGPVLEWYIRIKWKLEAVNYEYYDSLIGDKQTIIDAGCGYGYLSYYLHYKNKKRIIKAFDYDNEKAALAQNGYRKTANLQFYTSDIRDWKWDPDSNDVVFLNDILHYLSEEEQVIILDKIVRSLRKDGILFIREGIKNDRKHKTTLLSEKLSTKVFRFNKTSGNLNFISHEFIDTFAKRMNLHCEIISHSETTSNVLFILRK